MGVVFNSKAEVAGRRLIREFNDIFTGTEQFDDDERQIRKTERVGCFLRGQENVKELSNQAPEEAENYTGPRSRRSCPTAWENGPHVSRRVFVSLGENALSRRWRQS